MRSERSLIKATRGVAILLAEDKPPEELITRYPPSGPAISPKLLAPKLPIVNVLTAATSAQNRAGAAVKQLELGHRMEFFDPKTRPCAIFWDSDALLGAQVQLMFSTMIADIVANRPEEFAAFLASERVKWAKVVKQSGAQVD